MQTALYESRLTSLTLINKGKVRDIYAIDDAHILIVATDRLSAFDVVLSEPIPGKGAILTELSNFWFDWLGDAVVNHLDNVSLTLADVLPDATEREQVEGRTMIAKRLTPLPVEAIVRGYITGSGWKDYQRTGGICGNPLPTGLQHAEILPEPLYTPSTKAEIGEHDENISFADTVKLLGEDLATQVKQSSLSIYQKAHDYARQRGIIIADTKFEFGQDSAGRLVLIDEVLTPDSSRFWPMHEYQPGTTPPSFDKQFVRDYLETLDWDKTPPAPHLPAEIIEKTVEKYREAQKRLVAI